MGWDEHVIDLACDVHAGRLAPGAIIDALTEDMAPELRIAMATSLLSGTGYIATSGRVLAEQWKAQSFNVDRDRK